MQEGYVIADVDPRQWFQVVEGFQNNIKDSLVNVMIPSSIDKGNCTWSKGCSVNPCNFGMHRMNITAYLKAAGSKSKLIASIANVRNKDKLKAVVDVIKAHP